MSKLSFVEIKSIKAAKYNPREITPEAFQALRESIRQFGLVDPLIRNSNTGTLIGGHQRLKAAKLEGLKKAPVYDIAVTEIEEKALNVVLNNSKIGGYYNDSLRGLLEEIQKEAPEINLDALMLSLKDLDSMVISKEWASDIAAVDKVEENLDGITSTIKVLCPQEIRVDLVNFLRNQIKKSKYENVHIT